MEEIIPELTKPFEIKPHRAGILRDVLKNEEKTEKPQFQDIIVFGQGPVIDGNTRTVPSGGTKGEDINLWAKTIARAAGEMKYAGMVGNIIITGGKTGGGGFLSEAELMRNILREEYPEIPEDEIKLEPTATNTLENFAYTLNAIDTDEKSHPGSHARTAFLSGDFHTTRIKELARLYGFSEPEVFSAESIFRLIANRTDDSNLHGLLDRMLSVNDDLSEPSSRIQLEDFQRLPSEAKRNEPSRSAMKASTFFEDLLGTEKKGILKRILEEKRWSRGLAEMPKYWVGYLGYLESDERLQKSLDSLSDDMLASVGVDRTDDLNSARQKLLVYTQQDKREIPPTEWEHE